MATASHGLQQLELREMKNNLTNSTSVGMELDLFGSGGDKTQSKKVALDIFCGKNELMASPSATAIQPYAGIALRPKLNQSGEFDGNHAILIDNATGNSWINGLSLLGSSFTNGIDMSSATISSSAIKLASLQKLAFNSDASSYITYDATSTPKYLFNINSSQAASLTSTLFTAPEYAFTNATNSGIKYNNSNFTVTVNGTDGVRINNSQRMAIGPSTDPDATYQLYVNGAGVRMNASSAAPDVNRGVAFSIDGTNEAYMYVKNGGVLALNRRGTEQMLIDSSVTIVPAATFNSTVSVGGALNMNNNNITSTGTISASSVSATGTISAATVSATTLTGTISTATQPNINSIGGTIALNTSTNRVGIGNSTSPDSTYQLYINGTGMRMNCSSATTNINRGLAFSIDDSNASYVYVKNGNVLSLNRGGTEKIQIDNNVTVTSELKMSSQNITSVNAITASTANATTVNSTTVNCTDVNCTSVSPSSLSFTQATVPDPYTENVTLNSCLFHMQKVGKVVHCQLRVDATTAAGVGSRVLAWAIPAAYQPTDTSRVPEAILWYYTPANTAIRSAHKMKIAHTTLGVKTRWYFYVADQDGPILSSASTTYIVPDQTISWFVSDS